MYIAINRISFESQQTPYDQKEIKSLTDKIKSRFDVCVKSYKSNSNSPDMIVISALERTQQSLDKKLDKISSFCEESGFGRIESEDIFYEYIENLFE